jgi:signal transduction histidine kinase
MEVNSLFIIFIAIIELLIGFYVFFRGSHESSSKFFTFFAVLTGFWVFTNSFSNSEFWTKMTYFLAPFLFVTGMLWIESFSERNFKKSIYSILYGTAFILGLAIFFTDWIIYFNNQELINNINELAWSFGKMYFAYSVFFLCLTFYILYLIYVGLRREKGTKKSQLNFVFTGAYLFAVLVVLIDFILPIFNITSLIKYDSLTSLFFIGFSAYAILKFKLFSVKVFAVEALSIIITVIIFIRFLTSTGQEQIVNGVLFVFVLAFAAMLIRNTMKEVRTREKIERLAEDFVVANEQLRQIDKQKSDFISIASHQLRTPLTAIKGYASMILEGSFGEVSSKAKEAIFKIFEANQRMIMTVENFLTMSRLERGKMFYKFEVFDLQKIIKDVVFEVRPVAANAGLDINFRENPGRQYLINADFVKIKQVAHNLLIDSIHHTPRGFIEVFLTLSQYGDYVTLAISDTGEGATKKQLADIFVKHSHEENIQLTAMHKQAETELYIIKEIIKDHGGQVWAESEGPNRGKTYFVEIPTLKGKFI